MPTQDYFIICYYEFMLYFANLASNFLYFWTGWGVIFGVIEGIGLYLDHKNHVKQGSYTGGTLSELVWRSTRTGKLHLVIAFIFTVFWVWLSYHFFLQYN